MKMTTLKEVERALSELIDEDLAKKWINNDIVKKKLATGYDAWIDDIKDHQCYLTLKEYIKTCIGTPEYIDYIE